MGEQIIFHYSNAFMKEWKKLGLTEVDQEYMEKLLQNFFTERENHVGKSFLGDLIQGTGGAIKWRFSPEKVPHGKSGSARIIYLILVENQYFFLDVFSKSKQENLSDSEKKEIKKLIHRLKYNQKKE